MKSNACTFAMGLLVLAVSMGCLLAEPQETDAPPGQGGQSSVSSNSTPPNPGNQPGVSSTNSLQEVAAPIFSPSSGTVFADSLHIHIVSTIGATIFYTTDGTDPTPQSSQYVAPITIKATTTLQARAFKPGWQESAIGYGMYNKYTPPLIISPFYCHTYHSTNIWSPTTTDYPGQTYNITGAGGWWYSFSDADNDGGSSTISWDNQEGEFNSNIEAADMIDVDMELGADFDYPFAGLGFHWINEDDGGPGPYDISSKRAICLTYASTSSSCQTITSTLADFRQGGWGDPQEISTALTQSLGIRFYLTGTSGSRANFKIMSLGWYN